ncbi:MAG: hypothetical protein RJA07_464 [Bacteroidota bacterium]|jgi:predicted kinase
MSTEDNTPKETYKIERMKMIDLARRYRVSKDTMRTWIKLIESKLGERNGHYYTPHQIEIIMAHIGLPPKFQN